MTTQTLPNKIVEFNRTLVNRTAETAGGAIRVVADGACRVAEASLVAGRTVVGQTRSAIDRTATSASRGAAEVSGQTRSAIDRTATTASRGAAEVSGQIEAQGAAVAESLDHESKRVVDRATDAIDGTPGSGVAYEDWTRAELYRRAQELDIDGRATMNKAQLVAALRR